VFELFGASPRAAAMAGSLTAGANDGEAAFHNPAALVAAPLAGAFVSGTLTRPSLSVRLQHPICLAGDLACQGAHPSGHASRAPVVPADASGWAVGWNYPLGGALRRRVAVGMGLSLPNGHIMRITGPDPQAPHFPLYEGMPDRLAFLFAIAGKVHDTLWLGVGAQVLAKLDAAIDLRVNPTNHAMDRATIAIALRPDAGLTAGAVFAPTRNLRFGAAFRRALALTYGIPSDVYLGDALRLAIGLSHTALYSPDHLGVGVSWRPTATLNATADLHLARWSQAPDPSPQVALDVQGAAVRAFGLQDIVDVGTDTPPIRLGFRDTWSPAAALEWRATSAWTLRAGYRFRPTPAPRASGPFKYLDSDTHVAAAGAALRFGSHGAAAAERLAAAAATPADAPPPLHVDIALQYHAVTRRLALAVDPYDPVGSLEHSGAVWHATIAFGATF